jgi:hypothetical protein
MDQINSTLNALLANFQNQQVAFVILVAVTIFVLSLGLSFVFMGQDHDGDRFPLGYAEGR